MKNPGIAAGAFETGGAEGNRTPDLLIANEALSHLSYSPKAPGLWVGLPVLSSSAALCVATTARRAVDQSSSKAFL